MVAQRGLDMLLQVDSDGAGTYQTVAGIRSNSLSLDGTPVDITSQDDVDRYRQLLAGAGVKSMSVSGEGVFKDAAADATIRSYWAADTQRNWRVIVPSFFQFQAAMKITKIEYAGEHAAEVTFTIALESAGSITFTAL